jgi:hypothetical protein
MGLKRPAPNHVDNKQFKFKKPNVDGGFCTENIFKKDIKTSHQYLIEQNKK